MADEDLCELSPEEQKRLIMAGLDVTQKDRSGTFFQKDTSVIHCHSSQEGIEVLSDPESFGEPSLDQRLLLETGVVDAG